MKVLIIFISFYLLALLQASFFIHFDILGANFIFIAVIVWNLLEKPQKYSGLLGAGIGGFFLDIFSSRPIGFNILILLAIAFFIKLILKNYVRIPFIEKI